VTFGLRRAKGATRERVDAALQHLAEHGTIAAVLESHGIPYHPPASRR
jgi:hypothetical protein